MFHPSMIVDQLIRIKDRLASQNERDAINEACGAISQLTYAMSQAEKDVLDERRAQVTREGFFPDHDDKHATGDLIRAAACYLWAATSRHPAACPVPVGWPWEARWWKPGQVRRMLVKAGALILAEIDRLDRAEARKGGAA